MLLGFIIQDSTETLTINIVDAKPRRAVSLLALRLSKQMDEMFGL
jgi:hypothetical protein